MPTSLQVIHVFVSSLHYKCRCRGCCLHEFVIFLTKQNPDINMMNIARRSKEVFFAFLASMSELLPKPLDPPATTQPRVAGHNHVVLLHISHCNSTPIPANSLEFSSIFLSPLFRYVTHFFVPLCCQIY